MSLRICRLGGTTLPTRFIVNTYCAMAVLSGEKGAELEKLSILTDRWHTGPIASATRIDRLGRVRHQFSQGLLSRLHPHLGMGRAAIATAQRVVGATSKPIRKADCANTTPQKHYCSRRDSKKRKSPNAASTMSELCLVLSTICGAMRATGAAAQARQSQPSHDSRANTIHIRVLFPTRWVSIGLRNHYQNGNPCLPQIPAGVRSTHN